MSNFFGRLMRIVGPWLPEHKVGRANLAAAFPDKSPRGDRDDPRRRMGEPRPRRRRVRASRPHDGARLRARRRRRRDLRPALVRSLPMRSATRGKPTIWSSRRISPTGKCRRSRPPHYNVKSNLLFRRPNIGAISDAVIAMRAGCMGNLIPTGLDAPVQLANALERGEHVGMLVDQHFGKGVDVVFFGRWAKANPLIAQLARHTECADPRRARGAPAGRQLILGRVDRRDRRRRATPTARSTSRARCRYHRRRGGAGCASIRNNGSGCIGDGGEAAAKAMVTREHGAAICPRVTALSRARIDVHRRATAAPNVLLVYPRFAAATFWNFAATCELIGARYPAAPLGLITVAALLPPSWNLRLDRSQRRGADRRRSRLGRPRDDRRHAAAAQRHSSR